MKVNGTNPPLIERKITVFADPTRKARSWGDTTMDVNFERMYKKCMSVLAKLVASNGKSKTDIYTHTITKELPTAPPTQNTVNMERKEDIFDIEGFHKHIIGTAMDVSTNAHNTMTQSSRIFCDKE